MSHIQKLAYKLLTWFDAKFIDIIVFMVWVAIIVTAIGMLGMCLSIIAVLALCLDAGVFNKA